MTSKEIEIIDTKITDKWGVFWNEMETVRDFLQNFYDANDISEIEISVDKRTVTVFAPAVFDYQELIYLGSDKSLNPETIGQYGEGWKASVLNALRNFNCSIEIIVNDKKLQFYFEDKKIGQTVKRVVFCKVIEVEPINGSKLIVGNCPNNIIHEFKFGLKYFYFENNPLLGEELTSSWDKNIIFHKSTDDSGYVFYKRLLRSRLDAPIVIVCNKSYHHVDVKIKHDRDRKAFNDEVIASLLKYVCKNIRNKRRVVEHLKDYWVSGHKILSALANTIRWRNNDKIDFPENFYAKDSGDKRNKDDDFELPIEKDKVLEEFKKKGYIACPHYMSNFGMKTPSSLAKEKLENKLKKHLQNYSRQITFLEQNAINLLLDFIKRYSKALFNKCQDFKYVVGDTQDTIKDLKKNKKYDDKDIFLNKAFFTYNFSDAIVTIITEFDEHSRSRHGEDFSAFYISLISSLLKEKEAIGILQNYKSKWDDLIGMIIEGTEFIPIESDLIEERKAKLDELRNLFIDGKLKEVIEKLKVMTIKDNEMQNDFILLSEQYHSWHKGYMQGIEDHNSPIINKIKRGFLNIINELNK